MRKDTIKIVLIELSLIIILVFALFVPKIFVRYALSGILLLLMLYLKFSYRTKSNKYIYGKQVNILMTIFGIVYLLVFYLLGLYFGFEKSVNSLTWWAFLRFIMPFTIIIISSEYIRKIFLSINAPLIIKGKKINLSPFFTFISMVLIDLIIYTGVYDFSNLEDLLMALGFVVFASISSNMFFQYTTVRFGPKGIIIYRLITVLFIYILPIVPSMYIFFRSFLRMIYPFILYLILENTYAKSNLALSYRVRKKNIAITSVVLLIMTLLVMLISCQFKYGIVVIGSESMTGTIDKGDAIIYKRFDSGNIEKGQIIVFNSNGMRTIHRVIKKSNIDGEIRYETKGDANAYPDPELIKNDEIIGLVKIRIKYIGRLTLFVREMFER